MNESFLMLDVPHKNAGIGQNATALVSVRKKSDPSEHEIEHDSHAMLQYALLHFPGRPVEDLEDHSKSIYRNLREHALNRDVCIQTI